MGNIKYLEQLVEDKLTAMHTAFIGRVLSFSGASARVQPLGGIKALLVDIPVIESARYRLKTREPVSIEALKEGDLVLCLCCESDISGSRRGQDSRPTPAKFSLSDAVVVGVL